MSVVVFDGFDLAADRIMVSGDVLSSCPKIGQNEHFFWGFVGSPSIGQYMISKLYSQWGQPLDSFNEWSMNQSDRIANDEPTQVLVIPKHQPEMFQLIIGLPVLLLTRQPFYMGAFGGQSIYNYCKALNAGKPFARECVGMCITASDASSDRFACGPSDVLTVNPVEALQG